MRKESMHDMLVVVYVPQTRAWCCQAKSLVMPRQEACGSSMSQVQVRQQAVRLIFKRADQDVRVDLLLTEYCT